MKFILFVFLFVARSLAEPFVQPGTRARSRAASRGRASLAVLVGAYLVSGFSVAFCLFTGETGAGAYVAGLALFLSGFGGRVWALRELGESYSPYVEAPAGGRLVTTGPYAAIRHPIYAFYLVEMFGLCLVRPNIVSLAAILAVALATLGRIRWEEELLARAFGQTYRDYQARTRKLVPGFY